MSTGTNRTDTVMNTGTGIWSTGMSTNTSIGMNRTKQTEPMGGYHGVMKDNRMTTSISLCRTWP